MKLLVSVKFEGLHIASTSVFTLGLMLQRNTLISNCAIQMNEMGSGRIQSIAASINALLKQKRTFRFKNEEFFDVTRSMYIP